MSIVTAFGIISDAHRHHQWGERGVLYYTNLQNWRKQTKPRVLEVAVASRWV
jgi:hypothetical protein